MNAQQEAVALYQYFESRGRPVSVRAIGRILREELGLKFTDGELRQWLENFSPRRRRNPAAIPPQNSRTDAAIPPQPRRSPAAASREKEVSLVSKPPDTSVPSVSKTHGEPKQPQLIAVPAQTEHARPWVADLMARGEAIYTKRLEEMDVDELFTLGQLFAFHFANCTVDERGNRTRANGIARALREMALRDDLGGLSGRGMLRYGKRVWERGGKRQWFKPWDILGVVEWSDTG